MLITNTHKKYNTHDNKMTRQKCLTTSFKNLKDTVIPLDLQYALQ